MTYQDLLNRLVELDPSQLNQTVTIFDGTQDEYYAVNSMAVTDVTDTLDEGHFFLNFNS